MILRKIDEARELYQKYGDLAGKDPAVSRLILRYRDRIEATHENFRGNGVNTACSECARKNRGSCCFKGMEDNYDSILLFVNLLLGVELPARREVKEHCFFVGSSGCKLLGRYYFCLHYFCPPLERALGEEKMGHLLKVVGQEIFAGWELELAIRNFLSEADKK